MLNLSTARELITYIYESKMLEILTDRTKAEFSRDEPFNLFVKNRYSISRVALKFYRGLVATITHEAVHSRRLEVFGLLMGLPLPDNSRNKYFAKRCTFFFQLLLRLFGRGIDDLANVFATKLIERARLLVILPLIFPDYERSHTSPSSATSSNSEDKAETVFYINPKYSELTYELKDLPSNPFRQ